MSHDGKKKSLIPLILKGGVSCAIIFFIVRTIPFESLVRVVAHSRLEFVILPLCMVPIMFFFIALQTNILTHKLHMSITVGQIIEILFTTSFYNIFLPGSISGGAIYWYKFATHEGKRTEALAAVLFQRMLDSLMLLTLGLLFWCCDPIGRTHSAYGIVLGVSVVALAMACLLFVSRRMLRLLRAFCEKNRMMPLSMRSRMHKWFETVSHFHAFTAFEFWYSIVLLLVRQMLGVLAFYFFCCALHVPLPFYSIAWMRTLIMWVTLLPISFAGVGVRDISAIYLFGLYGIASEYAVGLSFLLLLRVFVTGLIGAVIEMHKFYFGSKRVRRQTEVLTHVTVENRI